jgi:hypothetical protein
MSAAILRQSLRWLFDLITRAAAVAMVAAVAVAAMAVAVV